MTDRRVIAEDAPVDRWACTEVVDSSTVDLRNVPNELTFRQIRRASVVVEPPAPTHRQVGTERAADKDGVARAEVGTGVVHPTTVYPSSVAAQRAAREDWVAVDAIESAVVNPSSKDVG